MPLRSPLFATPEDAERAFYEALEQGDVDALMAVWAEDEDILCVHPTGVRVNGFEPIRESWRSIFTATKLRAIPEHQAHWQGMLMAVHHLEEMLFLDDDAMPHGPLHVTHVYSRGAQGWRLVSRHASTAGDPANAPRDGDPRTLH